MSWKKILLFLLLAVTFVFLWHNGVFRTFLRAIFIRSYPSEIKKISKSFVEFDLSQKPPAILSLGIYYPENIQPKEIGSDINLFEIDKPIKVKVFKDDKLIKSREIRRIKKIYSDFRRESYKLALFYTFVWTPEIKIPGRKYKEDNSRVEIDLDNQFKGLELIIFDYVLK